MNAFRNQVSLIGNLGHMPEVKTFEPKFGIRQMLNRFTTRNQWFTETIETIRTSGLTLIISTIRFFKTYITEFRFKTNVLYWQIIRSM